ncbi:MAG: TonB-dependent receptor [Acidobacteria bacterium]|nr:TonB-dependent receptor [Acidobacteriota bacterium]
MAKSLVSVLFLLFVPLVVLAQLTTATISGTVKDDSGAVLPGATLVVRNTETGATKTFISDDHGRYAAPNLAPGTYELQASLQGFQTAIRGDVSLNVGQEAIVDFSLKIGEIDEKVVVTEEVPVVETTHSDISAVVVEQQVVDLPLNGRSFLQLAQLQTGVVGIRTSRQIAFGGMGGGGAIGVGGAQPISGLYLLDGSDLTDPLYATPPGGASGVAIGVDMIREFRVLTNAFSAEYGRTTGGVVSVVSKGGTNRLQGTAFYFHRNDNLDARNFFDLTKPEFKRNQYGFTLGGPLVKEKAFLLGGFEGFRERLGMSSVAIVPSFSARQGLVKDPATGTLVNVGVLPAVKPFLDLYPSPTGTDFGGGSAEWRGHRPRPIDEDLFNIRFDQVFSEEDSTYVRYTFKESSMIDPFGSTPVPGFESFADGRAQYLTIEESHVFAPTLLNTFRFNFNRNNRIAQIPNVPPELATSLMPNRQMGPITVLGLSNLGHRLSRPVGGILNLFQLQDNVTYNLARHSMKVGFDFERVHENSFIDLFFNGSYRIIGIADFLRGRSATFTGTLPGADSARGYRLSSWGFYFQDDFRIRPTLTLNFGLRYEPYSNLSEVNGKMSVLLDPLKSAGFTQVDSLFEENPSYSNFGPRFGFAWDPFGDRKMAIRGGFGIFFDRLYIHSFGEGRNTPPFSSVVLIPGAPFPNAAAGRVRIPIVPLSLLDRDFNYPYAMQYNLSIQRELTPGTTVTLAYAGLRGVHQIIQGDINQPISTIQDGKKFFPNGAARRNPAFGEIAFKTPIGNSNFNSFQGSLSRRASQGLHFQFSYTISKSIDNGVTFGSVPSGNSHDDLPDLLDRKGNRGLSNFDVRHNAVINSIFELPFGPGKAWGENVSGLAGKIISGWQLGTIIGFSSGVPFTPRLGFNRSSTGVRDPSERPDLLQKVATFSQNPDRYFDLSAFKLPEAGFLGNAGRNIVIGPGFANVDFSVVKNTYVSERVNVQFRAEIFNLLNRSNFATPGDDGGDARGGPIVFADPSGRPVPTAGKILRTVSTSRQVQFGLKITF